MRVTLKMTDLPGFASKHQQICLDFIAKNIVAALLIFLLCVSCMSKCGIFQANDFVVKSFHPQLHARTQVFTGATRFDSRTVCRLCSRSRRMKMVTISQSAPQSEARTLTNSQRLSSSENDNSVIMFYLLNRMN